MIGLFHADALALPDIEAGGRLTPEIDVRLVAFWAMNTAGDYLEIGCNEGHTLAEIAMACPGKKCHGVDWSGNREIFETQSGEVPAEVGHAAKGIANVRVFDCDAMGMDFAPLNYGCVFLDADHSLEWQKRIFWKLWNSNNFRDWVLIVHDFALPEYRDSQTHLETVAFAQWLSTLFPVIHPVGSSSVVAFVTRCGESLPRA